ncbi:hypothetical protein AB834_07180 [PVC group bacterium (ex Bugula neritina AB1)]|nr:hypothetical protein AB834_07180 [PVC group bacterium (ex Bugula neritina AB1)]
MSNKYEKSTTKHLWACQKNHSFKESVSNLQKGSGCPTCNKNNNKEREDPSRESTDMPTDTVNNLDFYNFKLQEIKDLIKGRKYVCKTKQIKRMDDKILIKCDKKHTWKTTIAALKRGAGCPGCNRSSQRKDLIYKKIKQIAEDKGYSCLFKANMYKNQLTPLPFECPKGHKISSSKKNFTRKNFTCIICSRKSVKYTLDEVQKIATDKGMQFLSNSYTNNKTRYEWGCTNSHTWWATLSDFRRRLCSKCSTKRRRLTIDHAKNIAAQKEGLFLSEKYTTNKEIYSWECKKRKQKSTLEITEKNNPTRIKRPKPSNPNKYTLKSIKSFTSNPSFPFEFKSENVIDDGEQHIWKCKLCYAEFEASINEMRNNKTPKCPYCSSKPRLTSDSNYRYQRNRSTSS